MTPWETSRSRHQDSLGKPVALRAGGGSEEAPVSAWLQQTLEDAVRGKASDLHFEPFESHVSVRQRVDGVLMPLAPRPVSWMPVIASRIKVMAELDIAESRLPQDGRIGVAVDGRPVDLRVSTLPTVSGESIVVRILDRQALMPGLHSLGMPEDVLAGFRRCLRSPHGLIVVTGPTGSGKTTTLYSALQELNAADVKILTAEDPVEYDLDGVMQTSVSPAVQVTFASLLRSFLRQDPDVIMVGEIRDDETAQVAVQAALTGHLVLSTLHTPDSASAVARLMDLGVEPFLISSSLIGVLAQRLVRRVCPVCGSKAGGCPACGGSGYQGRQGIFEFMELNEALRDLIAAGVPAVELKAAAVRSGMVTLDEHRRNAADPGRVGMDDGLVQTKVRPET